MAQRLAPVSFSAKDFFSIDIEDTAEASKIEATVSPHVLCSRCSRVRDWLDAHLDGESAQRTFKYYNESAEFERSFLNGCHLCTLIWSNWRDKNETESQEQRLQQFRTMKLTNSRLEVSLGTGAMGRLAPPEAGRFIFRANGQTQVKLEIHRQRGMPISSPLTL